MRLWTMMAMAAMPFVAAGFANTVGILFGPMWEFVAYGLCGVLWGQVFVRYVRAERRKAVSQFVQLARVEFGDLSESRKGRSN